MAEVYQRHVNLHVFCSHFNCDKELSLGNSLSAWEKALLPFDSREVVVDFLFRDQEERMTGRHVILPSRSSRAPAFIIKDRRDFEMKLLQNRRPALRIRKKVLSPPCATPLWKRMHLF